MSELIMSGGNTAELTYKRDNEEYKATVEIKTDTDGEKRIGLWVRDSTAGIGTMTFYDVESGSIAACCMDSTACNLDTLPHAACNPLHSLWMYFTTLHGIQCIQSFRM